MKHCETPAIVRAVLEGNAEEVRARLAEGASPNQTWGSLSLVTHAAQIPNLPVFRALLEHGAVLPEQFLGEVITWELGDWRITSSEARDQLLGILDLVRSTQAWLSADKRRELAERLKGYDLLEVTNALLED